MRHKKVIKPYSYISCNTESNCCWAFVFCFKIQQRSNKRCKFATHYYLIFIQLIDHVQRDEIAEAFETFHNATSTTVFMIQLFMDAKAGGVVIKELTQLLQSEE